ncbi:MAG: glycosyltransferase family 39 protein [Leptospiraceae bacterium]|nr:glycosyltransferase family 39 protein [Leptospiraceae bacterium]
MKSINQALLRHKTILLLGFWSMFQLPHLFLPLGGGHRWRQADSWAMAKNFAFEDGRFLYPRVDVRRDTEGVDAAETPFYAYTVSLFFRLFKCDCEFWGKLVSFASGLALIFILGRWLSNLHQTENFRGYFVVSIVQIFFSYSVSFMPEMFSLFFSVAGSYLLWRDYQEKKFLFLVGAVLSLIIGITSRPMQVFWGFIFFYVLYLSWKERKGHYLRYFLAGSLTLLPFLLWYFPWADYLRQYANLRYFSRFVDHFSLRNFALFLDPSLYISFFQHLVGASGLPLFLLSAVGVLFSWKTRGQNLASFFIAVFSLTFFGIVLITQKHFIAHNYYLISLYPALAYFALLAYKHLEERKPSWAKIYIIFSFLFLFFNNAHTYRIHPDYYALKSIRDKLQADYQITRVACEHTEYAWGLYVLRQRGFVLYSDEIRNPEIVKEVIARGVTLFVVREEDRFQSYVAQDWLKKIIEKKS